MRYELACNKDVIKVNAQLVEFGSVRVAPTELPRSSVLRSLLCLFIRSKKL